MGWNAAALLVRDRPADQALALFGGADRFRATGDWVTADVASSHRLGADRLAVADDQPWCWMWDPNLRYVPDTYDLGTALAARVLTGTSAIAALFSSVSSTYGFWLYEDGTLIRRAVFQDGQPVDEVGEPMPFEAGFESQEWFSGDALWGAVSAVTGMSFRPDERFQVYADRRAT